ncbi:biosynthetic-type acetolactate synthase large subunit [Paramaledivibacter caminithermalis]|jgi:acetolactate synthase-1/2/3 large subunit|uniref:Acetolactate synthase n=1 Tax=Paramaledivibacter caminithermalis (strain DSM 15212 / CIP 107654 / DViRD3) TaxID=1121301 RepID=A0A1M6KKX9_PARC5|nr:biosynthetic-type acetolactate synthase large subunit [Paramaledivibacter caminithermalis]SHJ59628.1 acetolactate synthase, large subunit [Paramaledivibacter caminithermalis DSM 15212]
MKVSTAIIRCLEKEEIDIVFGYPGGAVVPIYEELRNSNIKHILVRQEQAAAHAASGFARTSGKTGVCIATSGPGATNLITGIATAYMDSIPLVVITGQVNSTAIGRDVFQEADIVGATEPFTKHNYLVKDPNRIPEIFKEAFYIASTGRPGPVLIDIPLDIQKETISFSYPDRVNIAGYKPTYIGHTGQIKRAIKKLKSSKRPLICAGGGILCSKASKELKIFSEKARIPVVHTLMGIGALPSDSNYYVGMVGSHGHSFSNKVVDKADLLIIIGARVGDRATADFKLINKNTDIIHIDIDPAEVGKNIDTNIPVVGDAKNILSQFIEKVEPLDTDDWMEIINSYKKNSMAQYNGKDTFINPREALKTLSSLADSDTIFTADVGQNQIWAARNLEINDERKFFTSGGLGTMGYSLPAAIGAKLAAPDKKVVCILGDGSLQMSLGELATLCEIDQNITILLFNNNRLGMVRELQDNLIGKGKYFGIDFTANPDFMKIADAYGLKGMRITSNDKLKTAFKTALNSNNSYIIECMVDPSIFSTL